MPYVHIKKGNAIAIYQALNNSVLNKRDTQDRQITQAEVDAQRKLPNTSDTDQPQGFRRALDLLGIKIPGKVICHGHDGYIAAIPDNSTYFREQLEEITGPLAEVFGDMTFGWGYTVRHLTGVDVTVPYVSPLDSDTAGPTRGAQHGQVGRPAVRTGVHAPSPDDYGIHPWRNYSVPEVGGVDATPEVAAQVQADAGVSEPKYSWVMNEQTLNEIKSYKELLADGQFRGPNALQSRAGGNLLGKLEG
ncbi:MAG: hypothetical protein V4490_00920, partial [Pseudomonadota bacterium]